MVSTTASIFLLASLSNLKVFLLMLKAYLLSRVKMTFDEEPVPFTAPVDFTPNFLSWYAFNCWRSVLGWLVLPAVFRAVAWGDGSSPACPWDCIFPGCSLLEEAVVAWLYSLWCCGFAIFSA
jgi:hypothetical protein